MFKVLIAALMMFSTQLLAQHSHSPGKQVTVQQLTDISPSLQSGLNSLFDSCAQMVLGNSGNTGNQDGGYSGQGYCTFENMGTTRDPNATWGAKNSCHKNRPSDAVDVGTIQCGGVTLDPKSKDPRGIEFAKCVANQTGLPSGTGAGGMALRVIFGNGTPSEGNLSGDPSGKHDDHWHIMVPGCSGGSGGKYDYAGNYEGEGRNPAASDPMP